MFSIRLQLKKLSLTKKTWKLTFKKRGYWAQSEIFQTSDRAILVRTVLGYILVKSPGGVAELMLYNTLINTLGGSSWSSIQKSWLTCNIKSSELLPGKGTFAIHHLKGLIKENRKVCLPLWNYTGVKQETFFPKSFFVKKSCKKVHFQIDTKVQWGGIFRH